MLWAAKRTAQYRKFILLSAGALGGGALGESPRPSPGRPTCRPTPLEIAKSCRGCKKIRINKSCFSIGAICLMGVPHPQSIGKPARNVSAKACVGGGNFGRHAFALLMQSKIAGFSAPHSFHAEPQAVKQALAQFCLECIPGGSRNAPVGDRRAIVQARRRDNGFCGLAGDPTRISSADSLMISFFNTASTQPT